MFVPLHKKMRCRTICRSNLPFLSAVLLLLLLLSPWGCNGGNASALTSANANVRTAFVADEEDAVSSRRLLMIGNSFTYRNSLSDMVDGMVQEAYGSTESRETFEYSRGGYTLSDHLRDATTATDDGTRPPLIRRMLLTDPQPLTWVVLQEQSQVGGFVQPEYRLFQESVEAVTELNDLIVASGNSLGGPTTRASSNGVAAQSIHSTAPPVTVFFMTWGARDGDPMNAYVYPDFLTMTDKVVLGYERYANVTSTADRSTLVAPVGLAFRRVYEAATASANHNRNDPMAVGSDFYNLYESDGSHASVQGSFLAACVLFATLTGRDPRGLTTTPVALAGEPVTTETLDDLTTRARLQSIAYETMLDYHSDWYPVIGTGEPVFGSGATLDSPPSSHLPSTEPSLRPSAHPSGNPSMTTMEYLSETLFEDPFDSPSPMRVPISMSHPESPATDHPQYLNEPSAKPALHPSAYPSRNPSMTTIVNLSENLFVGPSDRPSPVPTWEPPTREPSSMPLPKSPVTVEHRYSSEPTTKPSLRPSVNPSRNPSKVTIVDLPEILFVDPAVSRPSHMPNLRPSSTPLPQSPATVKPRPSNEASVEPVVHIFSSHPSSAIPSADPSETISQIPTAIPASNIFLSSKRPSRMIPTAEPSAVSFETPSEHPFAQPSRQSPSSSTPTGEPTRWRTVGSHNSLLSASSAPTSGQSESDEHSLLNLFFSPFHWFTSHMKRLLSFIVWQENRVKIK